MIPKVNSYNGRKNEYTIVVDDVLYFQIHDSTLAVIGPDEIIVDDGFNELDEIYKQHLREFLSDNTSFGYDDSVVEAAEDGILGFRNLN